MKKLIAVAAVALGVAFSHQAFAHGAKAKNGGIVSSAGDLAFELAVKDGKAVIYVDDHGKQLTTAGASGKLTVLKGTKKSVVVLEPGSSNMLTSTTDVLLPKGSKAVAWISLPDKDPISVRFSVK